MQTEISPLEPLLSVDHQKSAQTNLIITISTAQFQPVTHSIHLRPKWANIPALDSWLSYLIIQD